MSAHCPHVPAWSPWLLVMCPIPFSVIPWCASLCKGHLKPLHIFLPTPTNKEQPQHCFSSWSLSFPWLHFLLSLLGRDFLEDLCTLISESRTACFTRRAQYNIAKKYFVLKILHLTPAGPISSLPSSLDHSSDLCILKMNTTAVIGVSHMWVAVFLFSGTEWCCWN